jgi:hypothetical protein
LVAEFGAIFQSQKFSKVFSKSKKWTKINVQKWKSGKSFEKGVAKCTL